MKLVIECVAALDLNNIEIFGKERRQFNSETQHKIALPFCMYDAMIAWNCTRMICV